MERNSLEDLNKVLDYNFKNSLSLVPFKLSCPDCYKVYVINPHEIMSPKPKFDCATCGAEFYINYPEFLHTSKPTGIKITHSNIEPVTTSLSEDKSEFLSQNSEVKKAVEPTEAHPTVPVKDRSPWKKKLTQPSTNNELIKCPKCDYVNSIVSKECIKCSVILGKANGTHVKSYRASGELKDLWELALENYDNINSHDNFIRYSQLENNLDFASQKYNLILSVNPHDDIANKMKKRIIAFSTVSFESQETPIMQPVKSVLRVFNIWTLSVILSLSIIGFGYFFSDYKNLIGVGASSLCLILCLNFLSKR